MTYRHKIGATLRLAGQLTLAGQAQDMTGWTVAAHMRGPAGEIPLAATWLDAAAGQLELFADAADQAGWTPGRYAVDVRLTSPTGEVLISDSDEVELLRAVTPAPAP
jgi:hypothetical protein